MVVAALRRRWTDFYMEAFMAVVTKTFAFTENIAIPDNDPAGIIALLPVSGLPDGASIIKMTVNLTIEHTSDSDLDILLIDPNGNYQDLSSDNGMANHDYINTTFDDNAAIGVTAGSAPFTGTFRPEGKLEVLYRKRHMGSRGFR